MCVKVTWVGRDSSGRITHIGGYDDNSRKPRWGLSVTEAIQRIESGEWTYFVARPPADPVPVLVRTRDGQKNLTTAADDTQTDDLDHLPVEPAPLSGIDPPWPLSLPGPLRPVLLELKVATGANVFTSVFPNAQGYFVITDWMTTTPVKSLRIRCNSAFPADLEAFVDRVPSMTGYDENVHRLVKVRHDSLEQQVLAREAGRGWFYWDLDILDPTYPRRFTPFTVALVVPERYVGAAGYTIYLRSVSYNAFCPGPGEPLAIPLYRHTAPPSPPPIGGTTKPTSPVRAYKEGDFMAWTPSARAVGEVRRSKSGDKTLRVRRPDEVGQAGWPQFCEVTDSGQRRLCQIFGFAVLSGAGPAVDGVGFSPTEDFAVGLAVLQPHVPGHNANVLFRFAKLGSSAAFPTDVPGFLATPFSTVTPRVLFDKADQLALIVDANQAGAANTNPVRARLLDLGHSAHTLATFEFANPLSLSAAVRKTGATSFAAEITTDRETRTIPLPQS